MCASYFANNNETSYIFVMASKVVCSQIAFLQKFTLFKFKI